MDLRTFSTEKALKLTSHPRTSQTALKFSKKSFWKNTFHADQVVWGDFKGKTIQEYHCRVAIKESFKFYCNCSSRMNPCKHSLALLILLLEHPKRFKSKNTPQAIQQWFDALTDEPTPTKNKVASTSKGSSASKVKRISKMKLGIREVDAWVKDTLRAGLSELVSQEKKFDAIRQRMTDSGLGGLRFFIDEIQTLMYEDQDWPDKVMPLFSRMSAITNAMNNLDQLSSEWQTEVLSHCGIYARRADLEDLPVVEDSWLNLWTQITERDEGGFTRKTWYFAKQKKQFAFTSDFNFREPVFPAQPEIGRWFEGAMTYYPSPLPMRTLMRWSGQAMKLANKLPGLKDFDALKKMLRQAVKRNPWAHSIPVFLLNCSIHMDKTKLFFVDEKFDAIPATLIDEQLKWKLIAMLDDFQQVTLFAEYDGRSLIPMGMMSDESYLPLMKKEKT